MLALSLDIAATASSCVANSTSASPVTLPSGPTSIWTRTGFNGEKNYGRYGEMSNSKYHATPSGELTKRFGFICHDLHCKCPSRRLCMEGLSCERSVPLYSGRRSYCRHSVHLIHLDRHKIMKICTRPHGGLIAPFLIHTAGC